MARGRRTGEVVLVVLKGVRSACNMLWRTIVKAATGITQANWARRRTGISVRVNPPPILWAEPDIAHAKRS